MSAPKVQVIRGMTGNTRIKFEDIDICNSEQGPQHASNLMSTPKRSTKFSDPQTEFRQAAESSGTARKPEEKYHPNPIHHFNHYRQHDHDRNEVFTPNEPTIVNFDTKSAKSTQHAEMWLKNGSKTKITHNAESYGSKIKNTQNPGSSGLKSIINSKNIYFADSVREKSFERFSSPEVSSPKSSSTLHSNTSSDLHSKTPEEILSTNYHCNLCGMESVYRQSTQRHMLLIHKIPTSVDVSQFISMIEVPVVLKNKTNNGKKESKICESIECQTDFSCEDCEETSRKIKKLRVLLEQLENMKKNLLETD